MMHQLLLNARDTTVSTQGSQSPTRMTASSYLFPSEALMPESHVDSSTAVVQNLSMT